MTSNKQLRKTSTFVSTLTYWLVLVVLGAAAVASVVVVVDAGATLLAVGGIVAALVFVAVAISYGTSMSVRKHARSR